MDDRTIQGGAIMGMIKQVQGLFSDINKGNSTDTQQTIKPEDEYTSKISDTEIIKLTSEWLKSYSGYYQDIEKVQDKAFEYWMGKQKVDMVDTLEGKDVVVNKLFEAIETFIPIATRSNPEPLVSADNSPEGQALAKDLKEVLSFQADTQKLRRKLARTCRQWMIYLIGGLEVEYDEEIDDIKTSVINPKRFIFDKEGYIDESGYFKGEYLGIKCKASVSKLQILFPDKKEDILKLGVKKGTKLEYIKWYYQGTDVLFTLGNLVLGKFKNPHWNYDGEVKRIDPETQSEVIELIQGINHLKRPTAPYVFLSIFNIGLQPHDNTSLILQNISQQDQINKRYRQLDKNIDSQNNGLVVDGRVMTQEQAGEAAGALRRGASIRVQGNPNEVIARPNVPQLPSDVWTSVQKAEQNLANIFGTSGSTPSGIKSEDSARGKIMISQMDASRIGGGITEYIEQVADSIYNLWVQMMFVHYENEHYINTLGTQEGADIISMINTRFTKSLNITVKEGSLVPKDPLTQRNEAIDLWSANAIDPLSLYKKLDFPDPVAATEALIKWQMLQRGQIPPEMYLPNFKSQGMPGQLPTEQLGTGGPAVSQVDGTNAPTPPPPAASNEAASIQSKQLMNSIPVPQ